MDQALGVVRDLHSAMGDLVATMRLLEEAHRAAGDRVRRAAEGHAEVSHFWSAALEAARAVQSKMNHYWKLTTSTMQRA